MNFYLGIDIGTSGTKAVCFDNEGKVVATSFKDYELYNPFPGYAEENPEDWYDACCKVIKDITKEGYNIKGIGLSGQMHGLVLLDEFDNVLRNSIIWCDNRATKEAIDIDNIVGNDFVKDITGNDIMPAFTLCKLLWVKNNEPEIFKKIRKVCLPKDYVSYKLTGKFNTEYSDASGMQMLDIKNKCFSKELLEKLGFDINWLPNLIESSEKSGYIKDELKEELKLNDCYVVGGAGDQAAAAIGNGIFKKEQASIVLGSSGVVFTPIEKEDIERIKGMQVFMHAIPNTYHVMGVTNGCGLSYKWFKENFANDFSYDQINNAAATGKVSDVIYLPYLNGERTPHLDPYATGTFIGIRQNTSFNDMARAVLEGVSFSIKDCFNVLPSGNYNLRIGGGGAKGKLWREIIASTLNTSVERIVEEEVGALGVAILAMVASGEYENIEDAIRKIVRIRDVTYPNQDLIAKYAYGFEKYQNLYKSLKKYYEKYGNGE